MADCFRWLSSRPASATMALSDPATFNALNSRGTADEPTCSTRPDPHRQLWLRAQPCGLGALSGLQGRRRSPRGRRPLRVLRLPALQSAQPVPLLGDPEASAGVVGGRLLVFRSLAGLVTSPSRDEPARDAEAP